MKGVIFVVILMFIGGESYAKVNNPDIIFFDFDGTIVDNTKQLDFALLRSLKKNGFNEEDLQKVVQYQLASDYGSPWMMAIRKLTKQQLTEMKRDYHEYYFDSTEDNPCNLLPDLELFLKLAGDRNINMIVTSGKDGYALKKDADRYGVVHYFKGIYGRGDHGDVAIPNAMFLKYSAKKSDVEYKTCWHVGDTNTDIEAAINGGCISFYVGNPDAIKKEYLPLIEQGRLYIVNYKNMIEMLS